MMQTCARVAHSGLAEDIVARPVCATHALPTSSLAAAGHAVSSVAQASRRLCTSDSTRLSAYRHTCGLTTQTLWDPAERPTAFSPWELHLSCVSGRWQCTAGN